MTTSDRATNPPGTTGATDHAATSPRCGVTGR